MVPLNPLVNHVRYQNCQFGGCCFFTAPNSATHPCSHVVIQTVLRIPHIAMDDYIDSAPPKCLFKWGPWGGLIANAADCHVFSKIRIKLPGSTSWHLRVTRRCGRPVLDTFLLSFWWSTGISILRHFAQMFALDSRSKTQCQKPCIFQVSIVANGFERNP
jgi:hypothetical protein